MTPVIVTKAEIFRDRQARQDDLALILRLQALMQQRRAARHAIEDRKQEKQSCPD
jgi:hypothetical protein